MISRYMMAMPQKVCLMQTSFSFRLSDLLSVEEQWPADPERSWLVGRAFSFTMPEKVC